MGPFRVWGPGVWDLVQGSVLGGGWGLVQGSRSRKPGCGAGAAQCHIV